MNKNILREKIVTQQRHIAGIIKDGEAQEKRARADIENATNQGYSQKHIAQLEENLSKYTVSRDAILARAQSELSVLQAEHGAAEDRSNQIQMQAQAVNEATLKKQAASKWSVSGGDPAEFEKSWPAIKQRIISEQVIASMGTPQSPQRIINSL